MEQPLSIDTTNLGGSSDDHYGLLTPLPSATEGRRGSVASSEYWSFPSFQGSASPMEASQGPSTPSNSENVLAGSFCTTDSGLSFNSLHIGQQHLPLNVKSAIDCMQIAAPHTPVTPTECFSSHQETQWAWPRGSDTNVSSAIAYHSMMPASSAFGAAFESSLSFVNHESVAQLGAPADIGGPTHDFFPTYEPWKEVNALYGRTPSRNEIACAIPLDQLCRSFYSPGSPTVEHGLGSATIVPSEIGFVDHDASQLDHFPESESHPSFVDMSPSPMLQERHSSRVKTEIDPDFSPSAKRTVPRSRRYYESSTGGKKVKKEGRNRRALRSRPQVVSGRFLKSEYTNVPVRLELDGEFTADENGFIPVGKPGNKSHGCETCGRQFQRVEHLTRHLDTHSGIKNYDCPVDGCAKDKDKAEQHNKKSNRKWFNRNDNLQEHYKTHLQYSKAGRNKRMGFDELYDLIRTFKTPEQAEKSITTLEKWRKSNKFSKPKMQERARL